jgi:undecaprenyl-diphosphatase
LITLPPALQRRAILGPLLVLLAVLCGLWAFGALMSEVIEGETSGFDEAILLALRQPGDVSLPIGPPAFAEFMRDISGLGGVGILSLITSAAVVFLALIGQYRSGIFVLISVGAGSLISSGFKMMVDRPRPDLVPHGSFVSTASFPSGHSMMSAVVYLTLAVMLARTSQRLRVRLYFMTIATLLTLAVGCSRVYLGVHWPTDVLAGWVLGASWAVFCAVIATWLGQSGQIETETPVQSL